MPTYVYRELVEDGGEGEIFEIVQRMDDPPLISHPKSGRPVRRVMQPPSLPLKYGDSKSSLDNNNLARLGFTKYEKTDEGKYEKTAGVGPSQIQRGDD